MALSTLLLHLTAVFLVVTAQSSSSHSSSSASITSGNSSVSGSATPTQTSSAQFPSLSGYPACVTGCFTLSTAAANCTTLVDVDCYCTERNNTRLFTAEMVACISDQCPDQLRSAEALAQQFCALAVSSTSLSFPQSATTTPIPIPGSSSSSSSSTTSGGPSVTSPTPSASPSPSDGSANSQMPQLRSGVVISGVSLLMGVAFGMAVI
jgi:hypothetical protein